MDDKLSKVIALSKVLIEITKPPEVPSRWNSSHVLPYALTKNTRGYIERVALQINITYQEACYDSCLVMIRRLIETLIIECFEAHGIKSKIEDANGNYFFLRDLISSFLNENTWKASSTLKKTLPSLKEVGDKSAHNRMYNAYRQDVDDIIPGLRLTINELLYTSKIR